MSRFSNRCIKRSRTVNEANILANIQRLKYFFNTLNIRTFNVFNGYKKHEVKDLKPLYSLFGSALTSYP